MGQFKPYVESYHPAPLQRGIQLVVPLFLVVRAVLHPTLESILWAACAVVIMLPFGIAPNAAQRHIGAWERKHAFMKRASELLTVTCALFLFLRFFLNRPHSILIAVPAATALFAYSTVRRRRLSTAAG